MTYSFDYLLVGGGCAGLAMAGQLLEKFGSDKRILIIDRDAKLSNDRTWAFWSKEELPLGLDQIISKKWSSVRFVAPDWERTANISPYQYQLIRSEDYYHFFRQRLKHLPNVRFLQAEVSAVGEDELGPYAVIGQDCYRAEWLFDSRPPKLVPSPSGARDYFLWQHFKGWHIKLSTPAFSDQAATLMDFSCNQDGTPSFFYCLPFSPYEALIEYTIFSEEVWNAAAYDAPLKSYIRRVLGHDGYTVIEEESGRIPMTNRNLSQPKFRRIRALGTAANAVKPTTGYAFLRIQAQAKQYAKDLLETGNISSSTITADRWNWYDQLLLYLLQYEPHRSAMIFSTLFKKQPFDRILRFLDEDSRWYEEVSIFKDLPIGWFLEAAWKHHWAGIASNRQSPFPKKAQYG